MLRRNVKSDYDVVTRRLRDDRLVGGWLKAKHGVVRARWIDVMEPNNPTP